MPFQLNISDTDLIVKGPHSVLFETNLHLVNRLHELHSKMKGKRIVEGGVGGTVVSVDSKVVRVRMDKSSTEKDLPLTKIRVRQLLA